MDRRAAAIAAALLVTLLWSSSWVLIKLGLRDLSLGPVGFAGLRYTLAACLLLPLAVPALMTAPAWRRDRRLVGQVAILGLLFYSVTQGAQFAALGLLPAVAVSLVLTTSPVMVALLGAKLTGEHPTFAQWIGIVALVGGAAVYFGPVELDRTAAIGLAIAAGGAVANALSSLLTRSLARDASDLLGGVLPLTAVSMAVGGLVLLGAGLLLEGLPTLSPTAWLVVVWLAVVNTAVAFTLWNASLTVLKAVESSVLNNTMLVQIAALAWIFLGEPLSAPFLK